MLPPIISRALWTRMCVCWHVRVHMCPCLHECQRAYMCKCLNMHVSVIIFARLFSSVFASARRCVCVHLAAYTHTHAWPFICGIFWAFAPSTLLKHENEIDSLGLKDGTADTNNCCQLPWQVSADNGSAEPNGTVAMSFSSNFLANICTFLLFSFCLFSVRVLVHELEQYLTLWVWRTCFQDLFIFYFFVFM